MTSTRLALGMLPLLALLARAQTPALSPAWNGTWIEDPRRSSLFFPGSLRLAPIPHSNDLQLTEDGHHTRLVRAEDPPPNHATRFVPADEQATAPAAKPGSSGEVYTLSANHRSLTVSSWRIVPGGSRLVDTDTYTHTGLTLAGTWRKTRSTEAPTTYCIAIHAQQLDIRTANGELTLHATLNGRPAPLIGPSFPPSAQNSYTVLGPRHLLETSYRNGAPAAHGDLLLAADGQTLTEQHTGLGPPAHTVVITFTRAPFDTHPPTR